MNRYDVEVADADDEDKSPSRGRRRSGPGVALARPRPPGPNADRIPGAASAPPPRPLNRRAQSRRSITTEPEAITYDVYMDNHRPPGCSSFCDEEPVGCLGACRRVCCPCCPSSRRPLLFSGPRTARRIWSSRRGPRGRSHARAPIGRQLDVLATMKRTGRDRRRNWRRHDGCPCRRSADEAPRSARAHGILATQIRNAIDLDEKKKRYETPNCIHKHRRDGWTKAPPAHPRRSPGRHRVTSPL